MENQILSQPPVAAPSHESAYFSAVPVPYLAVFGWMAYQAISGLGGILKIASFYGSPSLNYFPSYVYLFLFLPLVSGVLTFAILWGMYGQKKWTKLCVMIWLAVYLLSVGYSVFFLFSNAYSYNWSFYGDIFRLFTSPLLYPALFVFVVNLLSGYYLLRKVEFSH